MRDQEKLQSQRRFELEKQLHEQYAINNNAKVSSFVSFIVALFALFGFYGYVFAYTIPKFSSDGMMAISGGCNQSDTFTLEIFILMSLVVCGILYFLSKISLTLGYGQRSDQVVIDRIREKHYPNEQDRIRFFGKGYRAKNKGWCNFVQDYFNLFYWLFFWSQLFVIGSSIYKIQYVGLVYTLWMIPTLYFIIKCWKSRIECFNRYGDRLTDNVVEPKNTTNDNTSSNECKWCKKLLVAIWGECCCKKECSYRK